MSPRTHTTNTGMLILTLFSLAAALQPRDDAPPNVLILVGDDISERDMARLPTPAFDSLAARGLRFRRAYANPTCSPSRWSLHFGQFHTEDAGPVCSGYDPDTAPSIDMVSLPKVFSKAGYQTALFGKWHLGSHPGVRNKEPWEETPRLHGYGTWRAGLATNIGGCGGRHYWDWLRVDDGQSAWSKDYVPHAIRDAFLAWHAHRRGGDRPWFAMVCFQLPHAPLHSAPGTPPTPRDQKREKYESQVGYLDKTVAELLAVIDLERTLVVFLADNGSPPKAAAEGQDPLRMKTSTYEDGIHIPMVWAGPGVPAGVETDSLVHLADFLPTFMELVGSDLVAEGVDGVSLLPLLDSPQRAVREYVWSGLGSNSNGDFAVVTSRYKLRSARGELELFDLEADPLETENLADRAEQADVLADLKAKHERHLERL